MERLDLDQAIRDSVGQTFERWDGKGDPIGAKGEQVIVPSRLVNLADVVEVFHRAGGLEAAVDVARNRSGTQFDPALVALFCAARRGHLRRARDGDELGRGRWPPSRRSTASSPTTSSSGRWRRSPTSST